MKDFDLLRRKIHSAYNSNVTYEDLLEEFCKTESDVLYSAYTRKRRSMLLELQKDIDFNLGIYGTFNVLNLDKKQSSKLIDLTPLLTVPLLYCSAIDLMARVKHKVTTIRGMNGDFFRESAILFFNLSEDVAKEMWKLRNLLSHQYSIKDYVVSRSGSHDVFELQGSVHKVIFVRAMRGSIQLAANNLHTYLLNESALDKLLTEEFINQYGFSYYTIA